MSKDRHIILVELIKMVDILEYQQAAKRIFLSMVKYPEIVGGTDRIENFIKRKNKSI